MDVSERLNGDGKNTGLWGHSLSLCYFSGLMCPHQTDFVFYDKERICGPAGKLEKRGCLCFWQRDDALREGKRPKAYLHVFCRIPLSFRNFFRPDHSDTHGFRSSCYSMGSAPVKNSDRSGTVMRDRIVHQANLDRSHEANQLS